MDSSFSSVCMRHLSLGWTSMYIYLFYGSFSMIEHLKRSQVYHVFTCQSSRWNPACCGSVLIGQDVIFQDNQAMNLPSLSSNPSLTSLELSHTWENLEKSKSLYEGFQQNWKFEVRNESNQTTILWKSAKILRRMQLHEKTCCHLISNRNHQINCCEDF